MSAAPLIALDALVDPPRRRSSTRQAFVGIAVILWLAASGGAMALLWRYKNTPGAVGAVPSDWPKMSSLQRPTDRPLLLMFAHPMCPCTEASVAELRVLMSRFAGTIRATVVFIKPDVVDDDWAPDKLVGEVEAIRGVETVKFVSNEEARRFGALTSGHTLLYSPQGRLLFQGGITGARGHQGDNPGVDQITAILENKPTSTGATPVFGCGLDDAPGSR